MTSERYLKLLCEAKGPTGFERPVAQIAAEAIAPFAKGDRVFSHSEMTHMTAYWRVTRAGND